MKQAQVETLLDKYVMHGTDKVIIRGWAKGWIEVEWANDAEKVKKVRSKDLMAIPGGYEDGNNSADGADDEPGAEAATDGPDEEAPETTPTIEQTEKKMKKMPFDITLAEVDCPNCKKSIKIKEGQCDNIKCKYCGRIFVVRLHPDHDKYVVGLGETASGRDTVDINDEVAAQLRGMAVDDLYGYAEKILKEMDLKCAFGKNMKTKFAKSEQSIADFLLGKYGHLNPGMQRMNIGNLLRGAITRCSKSKDGEK